MRGRGLRLEVACAGGTGWVMGSWVPDLGGEEPKGFVGSSQAVGRAR